MIGLLRDLLEGLREGTLGQSVREELSKYRRPWLLPPALLRFARLSLAPLPTRPARSEVAVTLTTLPSRIGRLKPVLASLLDQTMPPREILLALPERSLREGRGYELPAALRHPRLRLVRADRDWGPATKLIPAWRAASAEQLLLVVDDDTIYPPDLVERLLAGHRRWPGAAVGLRGWSVLPQCRPGPIIYGTNLAEAGAVDVLTGTWGFLVRRDYLDERVLAYEGYPPDAFYVDDVWFSSRMALRGVARRVVPTGWPPLPTAANWINDLHRRENPRRERDRRLLQALEGEFPPAVN